MRYTLFFLLLTLMLGACKDTGTLEIKFLATYDDAPLVLGENLAYDGYQLQIQKSDFFVSEIALTDGSEVTEVKNIDFVDFTNTNFTLENAENGFSLRFSEIPEGRYDGLRFGIGVPPTENATLPADYSSDNVLATPGFYWEAWNSYIFAKLEGKYEDEEGDFSGFFFHTGMDQMFRTSEGDINIDISEDNTTVIEVSIDHKKLLQDPGGQYFDIRENSANHDPLAPGPLLMLVNNYSQAISYK